MECECNHADNRENPFQNQRAHLTTCDFKDMRVGLGIGKLSTTELNWTVVFQVIKEPY